jgi:hypothetical protein
MKLHIKVYFSIFSFFRQKLLDASSLKICNGVMIAYFNSCFGNLKFVI